MTSHLRSPGNRLASHQLDQLEAEAAYILREAAAVFERPALLFSGGKDSCVVLHVARKAFAGEKLPFALLHVDTGHNFDEVIAFRDRSVLPGETLVVAHVEDSLRRGTVSLPEVPPGEVASRNAAQAVTLLEAVEAHGFDALVGGARRDEEKARAKERIFSHRNAFGQWDPRQQRPELWHLFNPMLHKGEHMRVFPISNWTELDVWQYVEREQIALPGIYFSHRRAVVERRGLLVPVTPVTPARAGEAVVERNVRFRTVGDISCTCPVSSDAETVEQVINETAIASLTERGATRMDDQTSEASMERRKREGYF